MRTQAGSSTSRACAFTHCTVLQNLTLTFWAPQLVWAVPLPHGHGKGRDCSTSRSLVRSKELTSGEPLLLPTTDKPGLWECTGSMPSSTCPCKTLCPLTVFLCFTDNTTGINSVYTVYQGHEVMFHVSTMLPYSKENRQQVCVISGSPRTQTIMWLNVDEHCSALYN